MLLLILSMLALMAGMKGAIPSDMLPLMVQMGMTMPERPRVPSSLYTKQETRSV